KGLSRLASQRSPLRSAVGVAIGRAWLGQIRPALPSEHPAASSQPRSTSITRAPARASSSALAAPIAPPPTTRTSGRSITSAEPRDLLVRQAQLARGKILLQVLARAGAGDRQRDRRSMEEPGESNLGRCCATCGRDLCQRSRWSRERPQAEGKPGDEGESFALTGREHAVRVTVGQAIAVLHRDHADDSPRAGELREADVRDADVADLALGLELGEGAEGLLERNVLVDRMELVEVDPVELEPLEAAFAGGPEMLGSTVLRPQP